jgi:hypothetical protein
MGPVHGTAGMASLDWSQFGMIVAAIGALGTAAFGVVESLGKVFAGTYGREGHHGHFGLPYVGLAKVKTMARPLASSLKCAYGDDYAEIIAEQYRAGRSAGSAPDTIRQGVRLGLPFLGVDAAQKVIAAVWDLSPEMSRALAQALQALPPSGQAPAPTPPPTPASPPTPTPVPPPIDPAVALAGRFAAALDARISAAFQIAEEQYEAAAKSWSGLAAIVLSIGLTVGLDGAFHLGHVVAAFGAGLVAVPLAPVAKDLATSLQNALTAVKTITGRAI